MSREGTMGWRCANVYDTMRTIDILIYEIAYAMIVMMITNGRFERT